MGQMKQRMAAKEKARKAAEQEYLRKRRIRIEREWAKMIKQEKLDRKQGKKTKLGPAPAITRFQAVWLDNTKELHA